MARTIGVDLGTTNSVAAAWDGSTIRLIPGAGGSRLTPSVVSFSEDGEVEVGQTARHHAVSNAAATVYSAKRFIGRSFEAAASDREDVSYEVVEDEHGRACFLVGGRTWAPEEISAIVLSELKQAAEAALGEEVDGVVITVPAHFNDAQRAATRRAASLAGLEVRRILNEPTAAALAYGLDKVIEDERIVAVYDFGGGTFDVSILSVGEDIIEVIATSGDPHLGGDMIDSRIAAWIVSEFARATGLEPDEDAEMLQRLRELAEEAKVGLSDRDRVELVFPFREAGGAAEKAELSRGACEEMIADLVERTLTCCGRALADAGKKADEIQEIVLAGGSTRIPLVRRRVAEYFGREPLTSVDPDEAVAMGAAVQAAIIAGDLKGVILVDVTSLSLGIETHEGRAVVVIPRNTTLPARETRIFTTSQDDQTAVQFHVVQGESSRAEENDSLGRFVLDGLLPGKAGIPQIEVTFSIDINGMVLVTARDKGTGREQQVTVSARTTSSRGPRKQATPERAPGAEREEAEDLGLPPPAQATLDEAEVLLTEAGERMTRVDRARLMKKVTQFRMLAAGGKADAEEIERSRAALDDVVSRIKSARVPRRRV